MATNVSLIIHELEILEFCFHLRDNINRIIEEVTKFDARILN